jgi:hypothetical protein
VEFGRIELNDKLDEPALKPLFTLWVGDLPDVDLDDLAPGAWEPGGTRIAIVWPGKDTDTILLLDENKGMTGTLVPEFAGVKHYRIGNLVWSRDRKTLFAAAITTGQGDKTYDYSLAEIPVTGGKDGVSGRLTRLLSFTQKSSEDTPADQTHPDKAGADQTQAGENDLSDFEHSFLFLYAQVSLSPDGTMIAATPANIDVEDMKAADRALFLVDVRGATRHITRIPFPKVSNAHPQAASAAQ